MKGRILIVDDERPIIEMLEYALQDLNYEIYAALSGEDALNILKKTGIDLLVADIEIPPGMDGFQLWEEACKIQPDLQCILITGRSTEERAIRALKSGVGDYIRKPFGVDEVEKAVSKAMKSAKNRIAVGIMNLALNCWELTQPKGKNDKISLAQKSDIWQAQLDDGTWRTRNLDCYLDFSKFPRKRPDYRKVMKTGYYVLSKADTNDDLRKKLEAEIGKLEKLL